MDPKHPCGGDVAQANILSRHDHVLLMLGRDPVELRPFVNLLLSAADATRNVAPRSELAQEVADGMGVFHANDIVDDSPIRQYRYLWTTFQLSGNQREVKYVAMPENTPSEPTSPPLVARRLACLRAALGLSKAEFADIIEIDRSSYVRIEKGVKPLLPPTALRIYHLWGVDMNFLYLGHLSGLPSSLSSKVTSALTRPTP